MRSSPRKKGLTSLFLEVRVFKVSVAIVQAWHRAQSPQRPLNPGNTKSYEKITNPPPLLEPQNWEIKSSYCHGTGWRAFFKKFLAPLVLMLFPGKKTSKIIRTGVGGNRYWYANLASLPKIQKMTEQK